MLVSNDSAPVPPGGQSAALLDEYLAAAIALLGHVKQALKNLMEPRACALNDTLISVTTSLDYCGELIVAHAALLEDAASGTNQCTTTRWLRSGDPLDSAGAPARARAAIETMQILAGTIRTAATRAAGCHDPDAAVLLIEIARCVERHVCLVGSAADSPPDRHPPLPGIAGLAATRHAGP